MYYIVYVHIYKYIQKATKNVYVVIILLSNILNIFIVNNTRKTPLDKSIPSVLWY